VRTVTGISFRPVLQSGQTSESGALKGGVLSGEVLKGEVLGGDWTAIEAIMAAGFTAYECTPVEHLYAAHASGDKRIELAVADNTGDVTGFSVMWTATDSNYVLLSYVGVAPEMRGQGIGGALCQRAIRYFDRKCTAPYLVLEAKPRPVPLYRRLGFTVIDCDYVNPSNHGVAVPYTLMTLGRRIDDCDTRAEAIYTDKAHTDGTGRPNLSGRYLPAAEDLSVMIRHILHKNYDLPAHDPMIDSILQTLSAPTGTPL